MNQTSYISEMIIINGSITTTISFGLFVLFIFLTVNFIDYTIDYECNMERKNKTIFAPYTDAPLGPHANMSRSTDKWMINMKPEQLYERILDALDDYPIYRYTILSDDPWTIHISFNTNHGIACYAINITGPPKPPLNTKNALFHAPMNAISSYNIHRTTKDGCYDFKTVRQFYIDVQKYIN